MVGTLRFGVISLAVRDEEMAFFLVPYFRLCICCLSHEGLFYFLLFIFYFS